MIEQLKAALKLLEEAPIFFSPTYDFEGRKLAWIEAADALRAALAADAVPTEREDAASIARLLDAMSVNYAAGHVWDKLDSAACKRASIAIRALIAAVPQPASEPAPPPPGSIMPMRAEDPAFMKCNTCKYSKLSGTTEPCYSCAYTPKGFTLWQPK